jgi:hypothetical protein
MLQSEKPQPAPNRSVILKRGSAKLLSDRVVELARIVKAGQQTLYKEGVK